MPPRRSSSVDDRGPSSTDELGIPEARVLARKIVLRRLDAAPRTRYELTDSLVAQQIPESIIV